MAGLLARTLSWMLAGFEFAAPLRELVTWMEQYGQVIELANADLGRSYRARRF